MAQREVKNLMRSAPEVIDQYITDQFAWYNGDCCKVMQGIPDNSIDYIVSSLPFASLYTYSDHESDMGNCKDYDEFASHYEFASKEMMRVLKPGRILSLRCMNLPTSKERDGYIGLSDFRGDIIRWHQRDTMIYHSEVCIWKNPVTAMQRTKALGLLHKQIVKDSCMSRQGIPDYLVSFRKPGLNPDPVAGELQNYCGGESDEEFDAWCRITYEQQKDVEYPGPKMPYETFKSINIWQRYASPVWMDIDMGKTLTREVAREDKDERHICALQLQVIERGIQLWSSPGDVVMDMFGGIASTGHVAINMNRKFVGIELKSQYWKVGLNNLHNAVTQSTQISMMDMLSA